MTYTSKWFISLSIVALLALMTIYVPPNVDIFLPYNKIACWFNDSAHAHCTTRWDLKILGFIPWPRASDFQGFGALSFIYYPFYLLFPFWQSVLLMSLAWMALSLWLVVRLTGINPWVAAMMFGINFFVIYNLYYDVCPIGFQIAGMFAVPLLARYIVLEKNTRRRLAWNVLLGISVFLCMEYRPYFIYFIPGIAILTIACNLDIMAARPLAMALVKGCMPAAILSSALYLLILLSPMQGGKTYFHMLGAIAEHYSEVSSPYEYWRHFINLIGAYLLNFPNSGALTFGTYGNTGPQNLALVNSPIDPFHTLMTLPFWLLMIWLHLQFYRTTSDDAAYRRARQLVYGFLAASLTFMLCFSLQSKVRHAFHLLPVMLCILASAAVAAHYLLQANRFPVLPVLLLLAISQIGCMSYVVMQEPRYRHSWDRFKAINFTQQPAIYQHAVIMHLSWGTYDLAALYGPADSIVRRGYASPNVAPDSEKRSPVFIINGQDKAAMRAFNKRFPDAARLYPPRNRKAQWEVWAETPE